MTPSLPDPGELLAHAGWVRRLARALVGEDRADDLAQQTMLRALEQPPRRGGDPRPWLGRVMRNLAWSDHRAEGRRRRREARVGEAPADVPATPEALLARSEAHRLLVEDLLALEEPVRHLLILRYFEDLPPAQIARRLDLPPGTVRAQLSRGLDRLRARYRRRHGEDGFHSLLLLAAPPAGGALSGANLPSTVVLMSTSTKALAVFLALAVSAWLLRPVLIGSASDPEAEVHAGESEDPASGFDPDGLAAADPLRPQSEQRLLLPAVGGEAAVTPVAPDRIRLVGRCVDAETGAPLPRCEVTLSAESDEPVQEFRWRIEAPALTGQDGRFQAEWPAAGSAIYVQIAAAEHAVRQAGWSARRGDLPAAGATIDLGDVPMLPAWPIRGRVVDQEGAPLEAVMIAVGSQPQTLNDSHRYSQEERASSDRDGWFETEHPVPAGTFPLRGGTASHRLRSPLQVTVPPGGLAEPVVVVVRAMPSVAGVCLDESGEPVPNLHLSLRANPRYWTESDSGGFPSAMSREDGSFRLYAVVDDRPEVLVEVSQGDCEPLHEAVECLLGAEDVVVCVLSTLSFPLEVVDAATGEPVEDFRYSCMPEDRQGFTASRIQEGQHYPDGKTVVRGVWRGRNLLLVHPLSKEYARPEPIAVFAEEGRLQPVRVELEPLRAVRIRVVDEKGGPVTGAAVEAARPGNVDLTENTGFFASDHPADPRHPDRRYPRLLGEGETDESGRLELWIPPLDERLAVRVRKGFRVAIRQELDVSGEGDLTICLEEGAELRGVVRLWPGADPVDRFSLALHQEGGQPVRTWGGNRVPLEEDGSFEASGFGDERVVIRLAYQWLPRNGGDSGRIKIIDQPLATVDLQAGVPRVLELDARSLQPGRILGRVTVGGEAGDSVRVMFAADTWSRRDSYSGRGGWFGDFLPDAEGRFQAEKISPGRYRPILIVSDTPDREGKKLPLDQILKLAAGQDLSWDYDYVERELRVRVLDRSGLPLPNAACLLTGEEEWLQLTTDEEGYIRIRPAAMLPYRLRLTGEYAVSLGEIRVDPQREVTELERRVPEQE